MGIPNYENLGILNYRLQQFIIQSLITSIEEIEDLNDNIELHKTYEIKNATIQFQDDLLKIYNYISKKRILFIFDEIENISFDISPTEHWNNGEDFILFWQSIRSIYQKNPSVLSFVIAGVNPKAIETPTVNGFDNPIYRMITPTYLKFFDNKSVSDMVGSIANYMGLDFDNEIYTYLTEDYGGHPFLIRQVCSKIHQETTKNRPAKVSKYFYKENKLIYERHLSDYIELIIEVLRRWYPNEYNLIEYLAIDDTNSFETEIKKSEKVIEHLLGYNIIEKSASSYYIRIEAVKKYIIENTKLTKSITKIEDKWKMIAEKRNQLELSLRKLVKFTIILNNGKVKGKEDFLKIVSSSDTRKERLNTLSFDELFTDISEIYFEDLRKYIEKNWSNFEKVYGDKQLFDIYMPLINKHRIDAHAKDIDEQTLNILILAIEWVSSKTESCIM